MIFSRKHSSPPAPLQSQVPRLCLVLLLILGLTSQAATAQPKLRVGLGLPLSGLAAEYGQSYRHGLELALKDAEEASSRVAIIYEDHQYDNKNAVTAVRKLVNVDRVQLAVLWGWAPSDAVAPLSNELAVPLLLSSINPVSRDRSNVYNLASPLRYLLKPLADYITEKKFSSIAYITAPVGALEQSVTELRALLPAQIRVQANYSVPAETNDFRTLIAKLKNNPPAALGLFLLPAQIKLFLEQARVLNFSVPLLGGNTFNDILVTESCKALEPEPIFVDWFIKPDFLNRLQHENTVTSHQVEAAQGYFLGTLLLAIAREVPAPFAPGAVMHFLQTLPAGESPAGVYSVMNTSEFGLHTVFPATLSRITGGKIIQLN